MKKRIFTMLLCGLLLLGTTACDTENPTTGAQTTTETTTVTTTSDGGGDPEPPAEPIAFASYEDVLSTYFSLNKSDGDAFFTDTYSKLDDREKSILSGLRNLTVNAGLGRHGYSICDLNEDGVKELVFLQDGRGKPRLLFTLKDGLPVYVDEFYAGENWYGAINQNGVIYKYGYGKGESSCFTSYRIVNGEMVGTQYASYYASEEDFEADRLSYSKMTFQGDVSTREPITKIAFDAVYTVYEDVIQNPKDVTYDSNIGYFYTLAEFDDYYMLLKEGNAYYYELYDESENLVKSETSDDFVSLYREEGCDIVQIYDLYDNYSFYDVKNNRFSKPYSEHFIDVNYENGLIAYKIPEESKNYLVVQDIFDEAVLYQKIDVSILDDGIFNPVSYYHNFAPDGKSISLYLGVDSWKYAERVVALEPVEAVKAVKKCYVRITTNIYDDVYYISSGNPALLRPENGDVVRLLERVKGGEYSSDDGTRSDWYKIAYHGQVCYVTADSFEVIAVEPIA